MSGVFSFIFLLLAAAPATRPAVVKPDVDQLHADAVKLMRAGEFQRAGPPLEQAYRARTLTEHERPLVLNHAMLDIKQRHNVMRAIKDLRDYMRAQPEADDDAVNLMGAALDVASQNDRLRETELFRSAVKLLDEQCVRLEEQRPGQKKWGNRWIAMADFAQIKHQHDEAMAELRAKTAALEDLKAAGRAANARLSQLNTISLHTHIDPNVSPANCLLCIRAREDDLKRNALQQEIAVLSQRVTDQQTIVNAAAAKVPRPSWTIEFQPIDPGATSPPAPPPVSAIVPIEAKPPATVPSSRPSLWPKK